MPDWTSLPAEARLLILEFLAQDVGNKTANTAQGRRRKPGLAPYATVCIEWLEFIEKRNFHRLKLKSSCLYSLGNLGVRQRKLVKHIQFCVELGTYTCRDCSTSQPVAIYTYNGNITKRAIRQLLRTLRTWDNDIDQIDEGLTLELSVYSPSDSHHAFRNYNHDLGAWGRAWEIHDPRHGWIHGQRVSNPRIEHISQVYGLLETNFRSYLPEVKVVTKLLVLRQTRCYLSFETMCHILEGLPRLRHFHYEMWRRIGGGNQEITDQEKEMILLFHLPGTLRTLTLFEDTNEDINKACASRYLLFPSRKREPQEFLGEECARTSLHLQQISASFLVDAQHFFQAVQPGWVWNNLESLALTSQLLTPSADPDETNDMFFAAGVAATRMPKLRLMEIWYGAKGFAGVFRYNRVSAHVSKITWDGSWNLGLQPHVAQAWVDVALTHTGFEPFWLQTRHQDEDTIRCHGSAIERLGLMAGVVSPVSLEQMQREVI
ncbi:hypothetical protein F4677DRAFT_444722 [Hypoxylon crocopeplum]|nr:hypothetical protein F4677DRAFT_444722 [Hypoxylon crocopeplum]